MNAAAKKAVAAAEHNLYLWQVRHGFGRTGTPSAAMRDNVARLRAIANKLQAA